jgi:hypothetical protein
MSNVNDVEAKCKERNTQIEYGCIRGSPKALLATLDLDIVHFFLHSGS